MSVDRGILCKMGDVPGMAVRHRTLRHGRTLQVPSEIFHRIHDGRRLFRCQLLIASVSVQYADGSDSAFSGTDDVMPAVAYVEHFVPSVLHVQDPEGFIDDVAFLEAGAVGCSSDHCLEILLDAEIAQHFMRHVLHLRGRHSQRVSPAS